MASLPQRPPAGLPPLAPGWTEHKAPSGHTYYYNRDTGKSTYTRPIANEHSFHPYQAPPPPQSAPTSLAPSGADANLNLFNPIAAQPTFTSNVQPQGFQSGDRMEQHRAAGGPQHARGGFRGGHRGGHGNFPDRRRQQEDRPKHRYDIPGCAPWVLVRTKLGRRFVWNKETNESFWKFPPDVMKGVIEYDRIEREKKERRERGEPSDVEDDDAMAEVEAELAAAEEEIEKEIVEVDGEVGMEDESEYEEVEVTDDEGADPSQPSKRQRTEEPPPRDPDEPMEMGEDDIAWQLAQMEEMEAGQGEEGYEEEEEEEGLPLTEEDCKALFKELLDDLQTNPYTPWDKILEAGALYDDERYKALPNMKARKECFDEWAKEKMQLLKQQKAQQQKLDPKIPYLAFLHTHATPKLYWPEFRRKYKREPELKDTKLNDKDKEKLYRDHIKRLALAPSTLKSDLSALLKAQPVSRLNRSSTLSNLPEAVLSDIRFISLPSSTRDSLVETYISTLPPAPSDSSTAESEEQLAEKEKARKERDRREKALAERERRVREEKRRVERDIEYGKGRLRDEEEELMRATRVQGREGLRTHLEE